MSISTYEQLSSASEHMSENGKHEQADELSHLASVALGNRVPEDEPLSLFSSGDLAGILASDIEEQPIDWLWEKWIPLKVVTFLIGDGGIGKSTLTNQLIASVTTGGKMPDGTDSLPGGAVLVSLEEDTASVVIPRLRKQGADLSRVSILSRVKRDVERLGEPVDSPFMLPDDLPFLEQEILRVGASLVVLDPLMAVVNPRTSTFRNQSARTMIALLQDMAARLGIAVVMVGHFTKGSAKDPIEKMGGSKGFSDMARSIIFATKDPSNPRQGVLTLGKHSLCEGAPQIIFQRVSGHEIQFMTGLTEEQKIQQEQNKLGQARVSVLNLLASQSRDFTPTEITQKLNLDYGYVRSLLTRMAQAGQIEQTARGFYRQKSVVNVAHVAATKNDTEKTHVLNTVTTAPTQVLRASVVK
jgi:hypothetical protein